LAVRDGDAAPEGVGVGSGERDADAAADGDAVLQAEGEAGTEADAASTVALLHADAAGEVDGEPDAEAATDALPASDAEALAVVPTLSVGGGDTVGVTAPVAESRAECEGDDESDPPTLAVGVALPAALPL